MVCFSVIGVQKEKKVVSKKKKKGGFICKNKASPINGKEEMVNIPKYITLPEDGPRANIQTRKSDFVSA